MGLDISLLETFMLVADLGSFSGAARRLGLTQPAVSFQVKALEKELGADLIDRSHGKVVLTPAGRTAYAHAGKILADREEMIADIPRTTGEVAGRLRLGASTIPGEYLVPAMLAGFKTDYPGVTVTLEISDSHRIISMVEGEQVELGFVGSAPGGTLTARKFGQDRLVLITPKRHKLSNRKKVKMSEIADERWITRSKSSGTRAKADEALAGAGLPREKLDVVCELGSAQAVLSAVAAGVGIALVSSIAAEEPSRSGLLSTLQVEDADLTREFYAVYDEGHRLSRAAEEFLKAACGEI